MNIFIFLISKVIKSYVKNQKSKFLNGGNIEEGPREAVLTALLVAGGRLWHGLAVGSSRCW
jgi:hypothetical protein